MKRITAIFLAVFLVTALCISAGALTLESVESAGDAAVSEQSETVLAGTVPDIPLLDETHGKLIFYQSFDGEGATFSTVDYADADYLTVSKITGSSTTLTVETNPTDEKDSVLYMKNSGSSWHQYIVYFSNFVPREGKYAAIYDYMTVDGDINGYMERWFTTPNPVSASGTSKDDLISRNLTSATINAAKGTWLSSTVPGVCKTVNGVVKFGMSESSLYPVPDTSPSMTNIREFRIIPNAGNLYIDDLKIYYYPANAFLYKMNGELIMETADGEYTLPTPEQISESWAGESIVAWTDGTSLYYPGETLADVSVLYGKTLSGINAPALDESKGELVMVVNFEQGTDYQTIAYANPAYLSATRLNTWRTDGTDSLKVVADPTNEKNHALLVSSKQNTTYRLAVLNFPSIAMVNGKFAVESDFMLDLPENFKQIYFRFSNITSGDHSTTHTIDMSATYRPAAFTWKTQKFIPGNMSNMANGIKSFGFQMNMQSTGLETNYYLDNICLYAYPQNAVIFKPSVKSSEYKIQRAEDLTASDAVFSFPAPEEIGYPAAVNGEPFYRWLSTDKTCFYDAGDEVAYADIAYKVFYPLYQSVNKPARGFAYEGDTAASDTNTMKYSENVSDDGRTVLHLRQYQGTYESGGYKSDARFHVKTSTPFDPYEYTVFQYVYKAPNAYNVNDTGKTKAPADIDPKTDLTSLSNSDLIVYYYTSTSGYYNDGEHRIGNKVYSIPVDNNYHLIEVDMTVAANSLPAHPWTKTGEIHGFAIDPNRASYSGDVYVDYVRVYRGGINTVTYDTNAPEGAAVISEVAPDTGRGLGYGYLLKGERPAVEGYVFMGWATSKDAAVSDTVESIDLAGDTTVYAVWAPEKNASAPESGTTVSVRLDADPTLNGIRFRASVSMDQRAFDALEEYGFIVARKDVLDACGAELTHSFKRPDANQVLYVQGQSYIKGEKDVIYSMDPEGNVDFTGVCVGFDLASGEQVTAILTARPYLKYAGASGTVTLYGEARSCSLYSVVSTIKEQADAGDEQALQDYQNSKAYIDTILTVGAPSGQDA